MKQAWKNTSIPLLFKISGDKEYWLSAMIIL
jgi:hypothetical protein